MMALSRLATTASFHSVALSFERAGQAIAIAQAHGWSSLPVVGLAYWAQAMCLVWQGQLEEAEPLLELAEREERPDVEPAKALAVIHTRAMIDLLRGRDDSALKRLVAAERLAGTLGSRAGACHNDPPLAAPDAGATRRVRAG
jgi:LuxR family maltose regulon positive regulatory protein